MVLISKVKAHLKHKPELLRLIAESVKENPQWVSESDGVTTSYVDIFGEEGMDHGKYEWLRYFYENIIHDTMGNNDYVPNKIGITPCHYKIDTTWMQQYTYKDDANEKPAGCHPWHNHAGCHFTNIYFLDISHKEQRTEIVAPNLQPIEYDAVEGDIITFPAWMAHRSAPNIYGSTKTIISFNSNYELKPVNEEELEYQPPSVDDIMKEAKLK